MSIANEMQNDPSDRYVDQLQSLWEKSWPASLPRELRFPHGRKPICDYLREWAKINPKKPAIVYYGRILTFAELDELQLRLDRLEARIARLSSKPAPSENA